MLLDKQGVQRAQSLAQDLVRIEKEIEWYKAERERRARETRESFESFGRAIRNVQNAYIEGFYKPLNNALKSMRKGYYS